MAYHGQIKKVTQVGQSWTVEVQLTRDRDYAICLDNQMFRVFYERITGRSLFADLLTYGEWAIRYCLEKQELTTNQKLRPV
jgi:hypothetical protein